MAITSVPGSIPSSSLRSPSSSSSWSLPNLRLRRARVVTRCACTRNSVDVGLVGAGFHRTEPIGEPLDRSADTLEVIFEFAGAGDVGETQTHTGELAGQELGVGLSAFGDAAIESRSAPRSRCSWRFWASRIRGAA